MQQNLVLLLSEIGGTKLIWFKEYTMADIKPFLLQKGLVNTLGIQITEIGPDFLQATMPVDERTWQVHGILHGGATCALVETAASFSSLMCIDLTKQYAVGSQINVNHIRSVKNGVVIGTCKPIHIGRQKHVWEVMVHDQDNGKLVSKGELTSAVLNEPFKRE